MTALASDSVSPTGVAELAVLAGGVTVWVVPDPLA